MYIFKNNKPFNYNNVHTIWFSMHISEPEIEVVYSSVYNSNAMNYTEILLQAEIKIVYYEMLVFYTMSKIHLLSISLLSSVLKYNR